jgi:hypothetical protein
LQEPFSLPEDFLLWTRRGYNTEYEADAVATGLINRQAVIKGIYDITPVEGGDDPEGSGAP